MQILTVLSEPFISACANLPSVIRKTYKSKELIFLERPAERTIVIKRGYVRLLYVQADGRQWTRMILGQGALLGDLPFRPGSFLSEEHAISNGPSCLLEIKRDELENHARMDPAFQLLLLKTLSAQLQFVDRRMQWQLMFPLRTRIAKALVDLACFAGGHCGHGHLVDVRMTQEEFSELVVGARPVVSEILKEFKAAGMIDYTRSHLCLLNLNELTAVAGAIRK
ncbi:MAG: putative Regulatory protein Crp [Planctomycetaceae bacterium]|nr:putative Regulatory protein Crp [Planctomycetaceae bacterium]